MTPASAESTEETSAESSFNHGHHHGEDDYTKQQINTQENSNIHHDEQGQGCEVDEVNTKQEKEEMAEVPRESLNETPKPKESPRGWLYEFSLLWLFPLVIEGFRRRIESEDRVPPLPRALQSEYLVPRAHILWQAEMKKRKRGGLVNVLCKLSWPFLIIGSMMSVIQGLATAVVRPLLIRALIAELETSRDETSLLKYIAYLAIALLVEGYSSVALKHAFADFLGALWFTTAGALVQKKALAIPGGITTIQESSLLGNDLMRNYENLKFVCLLPMSVVALTGGVIVLILMIGKASIVGLMVMVAILLVNAQFSRLAQFAEEKDLEASDARLSILTQVISSIKAIKLSAWEENFGELVKNARVVEMACLARYRTIAQSSVQLGRATPAVCAAVSFIYMVTTFENVRASDIFAALNVFLNLRLPLILIPECITYLGALQITLKRLDRYLRLGEVDAALQTEPEFLHHADQFHLIGSFAWHGGLVAQQMAKSEDNSLYVEPDTPEKGSLTAFMLRDINIVLPRGARCAVLGEVGSGKSSLLAAILGELKLISPGRVKDNNSFLSLSKGFVPQESFVISGTIRENILFGLQDPNDDSKLESALKKSALWDDLQRFPLGLNTAVGERGVTLSGGQKARLAVARALYAQPELYIFDDVLAAVDAPICRHLLQHVFENMDCNSTIVASINQYAFLDKFTHVIQIGRHGTIARHGPLTPTLVQEIKHELDDAAERHNFDNNNDTHSLDNQIVEVEQAESEQVQLMIEKYEADLVYREPSLLSVSSRLSSATGYPEEVRAIGIPEQNNRRSDDLVKIEARASGSISWYVIKAYARGMGYHYITLGILCGICAYSAMALNDLWLAAFVRKDSDRTESFRFAIIYGCGCIAFLGFLILTSAIFSHAGVRASQGLHDACMDKVLHAPISWFEGTPSGRILSRFSTDIGIVDQQLSRFSDNLFQLSMTVLALIVVVVVLVPPVLAAIGISGVLYAFQVTAIDRTNREVKRSANLAMSPVQTIVQESVVGRMTLRAFSASRGVSNQATLLHFEERFWTACDGWNRQSFTSISLVNFSMLLAYFLSFFISTSTGVFIIFSDLDPSSAALSLTYSLLVPYFALHCAFVFSIIQVSLASLERVLELLGDTVPQEPEWRLPDDPYTQARSEKEKILRMHRTTQNIAPAHVGDIEEGINKGHTETSRIWPQAASISFIQVGLKYRANLPFSLRNVSFKVKAQERVAIVGKSGAGKSSIIGLLFRVYPLTEGKIVIDGLDISELGLVTLREAFSIIPQEPLLLAGTIRKNLDPFNAFSTSLLIDALVQSGMSSSRELAESILEVDIGDKASALSAGQRQLLSFARIILKPRPFIVCDEPTSFLDEGTDAAVQQVLRRLPGTKIIVAHRLHTIINSDRIIVMDKGSVAEVGSPTDLLRKDNGLFRSMAQAANLEHEDLIA